MKTYPIGPWGYLHVVMIIDMYMDPSPPPVCVQSAPRHGADPEHHGPRELEQSASRGRFFV